jgi:hypothetical protein
MMTTDAARVLEEANRLVDAGDPTKALRLLVDANRRERSGAIEKRIVGLRYDAFSQRPVGTSVQLDWPPRTTDCFAGRRGIPEVAAHDLDVQCIRSGVVHHGALIVRGLLHAEHVRLLQDDIHEAFAAFDRQMSPGMTPRHGDDAWFTPFRFPPGVATKPVPRSFVRQGGGMLAADSPRALFDFIRVVDDCGLRELVDEYFGEAAALSVLKTTLRDVPPGIDASAGWHQDGAFLGDGIRSLNVWTALSHCGTDAPSLAMVPKRLNTLVATGTPDAAFDWSVGPSEVERAAAPEGVAHLEFAPGDVVLFDEMNLHCTLSTPSMTKNRLAIEAWFFAPSYYPSEQVPLVL